MSILLIHSEILRQFNVLSKSGRQCLVSFREFFLVTLVCTNYMMLKHKQLKITRRVQTSIRDNFGKFGLFLYEEFDPDVSKI